LAGPLPRHLILQVTVYGQRSWVGWGAHMKQKAWTKCLPWRGFEPLPDCPAC